jgi:hypothetical protein
MARIVNKESIEAGKRVGNVGRGRGQRDVKERHGR